MKTPTTTGQYKAKQAWQSPEKAAAYRVSREPRHYRRYDLEGKFVRHHISTLPEKACLLDVPCGTGRFLPLLVNRGLQYVGADFSLAMIHEARQAAAAHSQGEFVNADAEHLPFRDGCADCVILWRFLHHIGDPIIRRRILGEAARVTRDKVLVSFHHPVSFTHWRKTFQRAFLRQTPGGHVISHRRLQSEAAACGLRLLEARGVQPYISINWFAAFEKISRP